MSRPDSPFPDIGGENRPCDVADEDSPGHREHDYQGILLPLRRDVESILRWNLRSHVSGTESLVSCPRCSTDWFRLGGTKSKDGAILNVDGKGYMLAGYAMALYSRFEMRSR